MATALHFRAFQTPYPSCSNRASSCFHQNLHTALVPQPVHRPCVSPNGHLALRVSCMAAKAGVLEKHHVKEDDQVANELTCVIKFGGSSVASADRMREVAQLILSFPEERPVIVLSAMGKTTNNLFIDLCTRLEKRQPLVGFLILNNSPSSKICMRSLSSSLQLS